MAEASQTVSLKYGGPVVIITDSRGQGLQEEMDAIERREETDHKIQLFVWKGRGITGAIRESSIQLVWIAPSLIIVYAGICDVTSLNRSTWKISMADLTPDEAISRYEGQMDYIRHHLSIVLTEKPHKIFFCEIVGADLAKFNKSDPPHPSQAQMEEVVLGINSKITAFNESNGMPTPWTAREVHHNKKSKSKVSRYQKLAQDGLHLSEELREKLANTLYKYICKIKQRDI